MKTDLRSMLEAVVAEMNKPEALAKYRTEAAMGRAYIAGMNKARERQKVIDKLLEDAQS